MEIDGTDQQMNRADEWQIKMADEMTDQNGRSKWQIKMTDKQNHGITKSDNWRRRGILKVNGKEKIIGAI